MAQNAGLEYTKWAGLGTTEYQSKLATGSASELKSFLERTPNAYTGTGSATNPSGSTDGGYCVYSAPAPYQNAYTHNIFGFDAPQTCFTPCTDLFSGCPPPTPALSDLAEWGVAGYENTLFGTFGSPEAVHSAAVGGALAAVATAGSVASGLGVKFALGDTLGGTEFAQSVAPSWSTAAEKGLA